MAGERHDLDAGLPDRHRSRGVANRQCGEAVGLEDVTGDGPQAPDRQGGVGLVVEREEWPVFGMAFGTRPTSEHAFTADGVVGPHERRGIGRGEGAGFDGDGDAFVRSRGLGFRR